jgi:histidine triad (HIT) family protein
MDCVFCRIITGDLPAYIVHQDEWTVSFLDINPFTWGHALVLPKDHFASLQEIPDDVAAPLMKNISLVAEAVTRAAGVDSFNVLLNDGSVAGQIVPHAHFHVIPRAPGDGLHFKTGRSDLGEEEMKEIQESIIACLADMRR